MADVFVYLAGPITGLSYGRCTDWREYAHKKLRRYKIPTLSPMRYKEHLKSQLKIAADADLKELTAKTVRDRDKLDVYRSDVVLMNLLGATCGSIGSMFEFAWAEDWGTPVIVVMEKGNLHNKHPFVISSASAVVETLDEGIEMVKHFLIP